MLEVIYSDSCAVVCVKPAGVSSEGDAGGMPGLIKEQLGADADVHVVHRLDKAVGGLMVYALGSRSAAALSAQVSAREFSKTYLAVVHGCPEQKSGRYDDLLFHDSAKNMTYVVRRMRRSVREASLEYEVIAERDGTSLVKITLLTGRTHQIRAQFASRGMPLVGDNRYGARDRCGIALWSYALGFSLPSGGRAGFSALPPAGYPWETFGGELSSMPDSRV